MLQSEVASNRCEGSYSGLATMSLELLDVSLSLDKLNRDAGCLQACVASRINKILNMHILICFICSLYSAVDISLNYAIAKRDWNFII